MPQDISPPPSKRRKTSNADAPPSKAPDTQSSHETIPQPSQNTLRIYSWNINGISPFLQASITSYFNPSSPSPTKSRTPISPASLRAFLHRRKWPELLFLQEVKISSTDLKTQDAVRKAVNAPLSLEHASGKGPEYDVYFTLPTDRFNARGPRGSGKVYGVCTILRSDVSSEQELDVNARSVSRDDEGRVSVVEFTARVPSTPPSEPGLKLAVFNIYAVNGTENPYRDPVTGAVRGTRHDRKLAFHRLLMEECTALERRGWSVVVAGDFNVAPDPRDGWPKLRTFPAQHAANRADFLSKLLCKPATSREGSQMAGRGDEKDTLEERWRGIDVWRAMHEDKRRYSYFPRGREWGTSCDRVDYVLVSERLWTARQAAAADILDTEADRGPSDHVPVWISISLDTNIAPPGEFEH